MARKPTTELSVVPTPKREVLVSDDPIPILDSARFEQMVRVSQVMATAMLIPESIWKEGGQALEARVVQARCFLIVNQAVRWNVDPFAVAQKTSVIHGKLCYEGQLVQGVVEAKLGINFDWQYIGKPEDGDAFGIKVSGTFPDGKVRELEGTVGEWKTVGKEGKETPWSQVKNRRRQLHYRGTREWCRWYAPGIILGVYTDDELEELADNARSRRAAPVSSGIMSRLPGVQAAGVPEVSAVLDTEEAKANGKAKAADRAADEQPAGAEGAPGEDDRGGPADEGGAAGPGGGSGQVDPDALTAEEKTGLHNLATMLASAKGRPDIEAIMETFKEQVGIKGRAVFQLKAEEAYQAALKRLAKKK